MKTAERANPMIWSRVDPKDRQEAQELADELYDGNLSLLIRMAVKAFIRSMKPEKQEAAA